MTVHIPSAKKRSRLWFEWNATDCLNATDHALDALTGQVATFTRASIKTAIDQNGVVRLVPHSRPAWEWVYDATLGMYAPGVLLEDTRTNLCLQSENFGTTWAAVGTPTRTAGAHTTAGISLDLLGDADAGTLDGYSQTVTFTGNAAKSVSLFVKIGTATTSAVRLRDTSASADRLLGVVTWSGTVPSVAMTTGTYVGSQACYDGVYRLLFVTTSVTAANTNSLQVYPAADA